LPDKIDPKTEERKEAEEVLRQQPTTTWDFITEGFRLGLDVVL